MINEKEYKLLISIQVNIADYLYKSQKNDLTAAAFYIGKASAKIDELTREYEENGGKLEDDD